MRPAFPGSAVFRGEAPRPEAERPPSASWFKHPLSAGAALWLPGWGRPSPLLETHSFPQLLPLGLPS